MLVDTDVYVPVVFVCEETGVPGEQPTVWLSICCIAMSIWLFVICTVHFVKLMYFIVNIIWGNN